MPDRLPEVAQCKNHNKSGDELSVAEHPHPMPFGGWTLNGSCPCTSAPTFTVCLFVLRAHFSKKGGSRTE